MEQQTQFSQMEYVYHPNYKASGEVQASLLTPDESPLSVPTQQFANSMQPLTPGLLFEQPQQQTRPTTQQSSNYPQQSQQYFDYSPRPYPMTSPHALQPYYNQHQNVPYMKEDLKKKQHKLAEQKRRDEAKNALTNLRDAVPYAKERKMARVEILQAAKLYIDYLESKLGEGEVIDSEFREILTNEMQQ